jgi:hypothetical protein
MARNELESMQLEVESLAAQRAKWGAEHEAEERAAAAARAAREVELALFTTLFCSQNSN